MERTAGYEPAHGLHVSALTGSLCLWPAACTHACLHLLIHLLSINDSIAALHNRVLQHCPSPTGGQVCRRGSGSALKSAVPDMLHQFMELQRWAKCYWHVGVCVLELKQQR